jgi:hypothetical protein
MRSSKTPTACNVSVYLGDHRVDVLRFLAERAETTHQPLRFHHSERSGQQERLDAHVSKTRDSGERIVQSILTPVDDSTAEFRFASTSANARTRGEPT